PTPPTGPTGPTGPRGKAAGTDWHDWWGGERKRWWKEHQRTSATKGAALTGGIAPGPWVGELTKVMDGGRNWTDRAGLADGIAYVRSPLLLDLSHDEVARLGIYATAASMPTSAAGLTQLSQVLQDRTLDDHPRGAAAAAIGALGDPAGLDLLQRTMRAPLDPAIRVGAVVGVGLLGDVKSIPYLQSVILNKRENVPVRTAALIALGEIAKTEAGARPATTALLTVTKNLRRLHPEARQTAALNLCHAEPNMLVTARLTDILQNDGDQRTRALAALALGRLARREPELVQERARRAIVARWDKEAPSVRGFLALGLGLAKCTAETKRLSRWLNGSGDPLHRGAAAIALGLMEDPAVLDALRLASTNGPPRLRADAVEAIGHVGGPQALAILRKRLNNGPSAARGAAAYALGIIGNAEDEKRIKDAMESHSPDVRMGGVLGLTAFGGPEARDHLIKHANRDGLPNIRALAFYGASLAIGPRPLLARGKDLDRSPWAREH
ncbi:MAG: HEAT repeat domain-containing protein, partial [Planctomycetota bacterium]